MSRFSELAPRWGAVLGWVLCGLLVVGCKTGNSNAGFASFNDASAGVSNSPPSGAATPGGANESTEMRRLRVGDVLKITFSDIPIPVAPIEQTIKEDGTIILLENKTFTAAGKTRSELEKEIHDTYVPKLFVRMTVSVEWKEQTRFFFVGGEVKREDRQVYISRVTVVKAIQSAGGFTDFANKRKIQLTRADGRKVFLNYNKLIKDPRMDPEVYPGDSITVWRRGPLW
jgi:protein involved in polysaccharide export with SLBB domain